MYVSHVCVYICVSFSTDVHMTVCVSVALCEFEVHAGLDCVCV